MCRLINWWIDTILQVWTVATFSVSCCSLPVPILSIHLTTESFLLYLFPHCLRKVLLIFIGNRQRCLQATLQKRKKKPFCSCDHLDLPLLPPWWLVHVSHHFTMLSSQHRQCCRDNSAGMWNYRLLFMHDFARFASVYTLTQKALCKTIYLHFKSKTFGYFTVQKKHFKMMIDVTTILIITSI